MLPQELYDIYDPEKYSIDLGGSCVGHVGGSDDWVEYDEIRIMPPFDNNENPVIWDNTRPWAAIQDNINLGKRATVNIDQYITRTEHWFPGETKYKQQVDDICVGILERAEGTEFDILELVDLTVDNEMLKDHHHPTVDSYLQHVRWAREASKPYGFKLSGGGEEFAMIERRVAEGDKNLTEEMCKLYVEGIIQKVAIHIQGSCQSDESRKRWTEFVKVFQERFQVYDWIDTESNYVDPRNRFYSDWIPQIKMALDLRCDAAGFVFVDYKHLGSPYGPDYTWLALMVEGNLRVPQSIWDDFIDLAAKYKSERKLKGGKDGMVLQTLYDKEYEEVEGKRYGPYKTSGYLVEWAHMMLKNIVDNTNLPFWDGEISNIYSGSFKEAVKDFQTLLKNAGYPNIDIDGKWGRKMYGWAVEVLIDQDSEKGLSMDRILHKWSAPRK